MKKTIVIAGLILGLIAGRAFAMTGGGGHGSMHDERTESGQMGWSMDKGSMNQGTMKPDSMDQGSMDNQTMQMDHGGMTQDEQRDRSEKMHGTSGSGRD